MVDWNFLKPKLIRHGSCVFLGWAIGPYFAAWMTEVLVWMGARGDFTVLDLLWRVIMIAAFELAWFYATLRLSDIPTKSIDPAR